MANQAVLEKVLADEEFVKELDKMENPEEIRDALNAKGAEITVEEVRQITKSLSAQAQPEGELDEDALEDVAGGAAGLMISKGMQALLAQRAAQGQKGSVARTW